LFEAKADAVEERTVGGFETLGFRPEALCLYRDPISRNPYLFLLDGEGSAEQWLLAAGDQDWQSRLVRRLPVGGETTACAVDDASGQLHVVEEDMAVWRYGAHPEAGSGRRPVAMVAPWGELRSPEGVAVDAARNLLIASDSGDNRLHFFDLDSGDPVACMRLIGAGNADIEIEAVSVPMAPWFLSEDGHGHPPRAGLVVIEAEGGPRCANYGWVDPGSVTAATGREPRSREMPAEAVPVVPARAATEPVVSGGDAADDPAIWVHPEDPARSLILGTDKKAGLAFYDIRARQRQFLADGFLNNVDVRDGFEIDGRRVALAAASNRSDATVGLYLIDPETARVRAAPVAAPIATGFNEPYGLCLYHSRRSGAHYVFVNDKEGQVRQWRLAVADGAVTAEMVREWSVGSTTEGCVADDATHDLFIGEEAVAIWRYAAEPDAGSDRIAVDRTRAHGGPHLTGDIEGLALYRDGESEGYLLASSQGDNGFAVYRLVEGFPLVGRFRVGMNLAAGLDGVSETDGIEVR